MIIQHRTLLLGAPGTGKTALVEQAFHHVERILLAGLPPDEFAGQALPDGSIMPHPRIRRLHDAAESGKTTCLFLDEIDKAPPYLQAPLLSLVDTGLLPSGHSVPDGCAVVAAANPPEYGGEPIERPMLRRFVVREFAPDVDQWADWAEQQSPLLARVSRAVRRDEMPLLEEHGEGWGWRSTSPATIELACRQLEHAQSESEAVEILAGCVTASAASVIMAMWQQSRGCEPRAERDSKLIRRASKRGKSALLRGK